MDSFAKAAVLVLAVPVALAAGVAFGTRPTESYDPGPARLVQPSRDPVQASNSGSESSSASPPLVTPETEPRSGAPGIELPTETTREGANTYPSTPATSPEITILGDEYCIGETTNALNLLRDKADTHYDVVTGHIGIIECAEAWSGMYAWESPPRYQAGRATVQAGAIWYAGTIAHDACHAKQYQDHAHAHPSEQVPQEAFSGEQAEAQCLDAQYDALVQMGAGQEALDAVDAALTTRYCEVNYEERWW